jgi:hypothetical protein
VSLFSAYESPDASPKSQPAEPDASSQIDGTAQENKLTASNTSGTGHNDEETMTRDRENPPHDLIDPPDVERRLGGPNDIIQTGEVTSSSPLELSPLWPSLNPPRVVFLEKKLLPSCWISQSRSHPSLCLDRLASENLPWPSLSFTMTESKLKFGRNRHFARCDDLTNSLEGFLERLSDAMGTSRTTDTGQLRSHLESSPPLILLLDGVDSILDPLAPEAEEISAMIEEFGSYQHVCLLTTSRMDPEIPGFHRVEVPTLSGDAARDAFYGLSHLGRSPVVDDLLAKLDFHPLSIDLLASSVRENGWDESALLKAVDDDQEGVLKTQYYQHLKDAVERSFHSPTIRSLGHAARNALVAIAAFPRGVEETQLESVVPWNDWSRGSGRRTLQVLPRVSPRWICENALTIPVLLPGACAGTCTTCGSYPLGRR